MAPQKHLEAHLAFPEMKSAAHSNSLNPHGSQRKPETDVRASFTDTISLWTNS